MSELNITQETEVSDATERYTALPDTSPEIQEVIRQTIDNGQGIHLGGFMDEMDYARVQVGPGNGSPDELKVADKVARNSYNFSGDDNNTSVTYSGDSVYSGLNIEEARDAAVGGMSLAATLRGGNAESLKVVKIDNMSPQPDRNPADDRTGVLQVIAFEANGGRTYAVECLSIYGRQLEDGAESRFGELEDFTVARRSATPQEVANYWQEKNQ